MQLTISISWGSPDPCTGDSQMRRIDPEVDAALVTSLKALEVGGDTIMGVAVRFHCCNSGANDMRMRRRSQDRRGEQRGKEQGDDCSYVLGHFRVPPTAVSAPQLPPRRNRRNGRASRSLEKLHNLKNWGPVTGEKHFRSGWADETRVGATTARCGLWLSARSRPDQRDLRMQLTPMVAP